MTSQAQVQAKTPAIIAARHIVRGDISAAAEILLDGKQYQNGALLPCEARAIIGACRYARGAYAGCEVTIGSLVWGW